MAVVVKKHKHLTRMRTNRKEKKYPKTFINISQRL